uniref:3-oxoacyl-ACP synthase III (KS) n=1 Tax=Amycolatopsis orientalis TaxID=31958 RepID=K4FDR4_AMYOR|nr:3-oxoacyl-ACP synthase III (KS) [Amycolatopsis orientalis]
MGARQTYVLAAGTAFPGPLVDNAALAARFGTTGAWQQWVDTFIGTRTRHLAVDPDTGKPHATLAELGEEAGRQALTGAGLAPGDIDLVVMGSATPDQLMPATVNLIADRLGIDQVPTYQLQSGCTGAVQALDLASQLLSTGRHRNALVLGGDVCVKHLDFDADFAALPPAQQVNFILFGDGAGAAVLSTEPGPDPVELRHVFVRLVGLGRPPGQVVEWFGVADRDDDRAPVLEDYKAIEDSVPALAAEALDEVLGELDWAAADLDYLLPPQLSGKMTANIVEHLDMPDAHEVTCVAETGNVGNAMPFVQLAKVLPWLSQGDRVAGIAIESSKWIKSGFAVEKI